MAHDTRGQWVGPISYDAFFAEHMNVDEPVPANLVAPNYFDKIPTGKGKAEKDMYDPLIKLVANAKLLDPACVLVNTSNHADFDSYVEAQWKPDVTCYLREDFCKENPRDEDYRPTKTKGSIKERNPDNNTFFDKNQLCVKMKLDDVSPFNDPPKELSGEALRKFHFENKTYEGTQARGKIGAALTEICARQHRTRTFFVLMNAKEVRFLLHDRCATLVTRAVNYREESGVLAEFFWRFARLTPAQRGIDETVRLATSDLETGNVVFLKETWRADLSGMEKESDILKELNDKGVRYVPKFQYGNDIKQPYHTTNNHRYVKASWRAGPLRDVFRKTHHRFTELFVGNHLDKFTTPKNLLRAVNHAVIAHQDAYRVCSILHRDVSGNNVLLDDEENGCLNDWDMAKRVPRYLSNPDAAEEEDAAADQEELAADKKREEKLEKEEDLPELEAQDDDDGEEEDEYEEFSRHTYRTGTWYFISALLLRHPEKVHSLHDDLESFFYVVLFFTLQYLPVNLSQVQLVDFMQSVFEECRLNNKLGIDVGGEAKTSLFIRNDSQIMDLVFLDNRPLTAWVQHARFAFGQFHRYVEREDRPLISFSEKDEHATELAPRLTPGRQIPLPADILLRDHSYLLQLFGQALAPDNWPDNRKETAAVAQFIAPDTTQTPAGVKWTHEGDEATVTKRSRCDILLSRQGGVNS